jgi:YVTN family beta-propeller protein
MVMHVGLPPARSLRLAAWITAALATIACSGGPTATTPGASPSATTAVIEATSPLASAKPIPVRPIAARTYAVADVTDMSRAGDTLFMISGAKVATLNLTTHAIGSITVAGADELEAIEVTSTSIWLADFGHNRVIRLDRASGSTPKAIDVGAAEDVLAVGDAIWVTNHHEGSVSRIDAKTDAVIGTVSVAEAGHNGPGRLALGAGSVWVDVSSAPEMVRLDPVSGAVIAHIPLKLFEDCGGILATDAAVWATACHDSPMIGRIDPATNTEVAAVALDGYAQEPVTVNGDVWVAVGGTGSPGELERIDPATNQVATRLSIDGLDDVSGSVVAADALWVGDGTTKVFEIPLSELEP